MGIATELRARRSGVRISVREEIFLVLHSLLFIRYRVSFPGVKLRSGKSGAVPRIPLVTSWCVHGQSAFNTKARAIS